MVNRHRFCLFTVSPLLLASGASGLVINPTYVAGAGEAWSSDRIATFEQAMMDWTSLIQAPAGAGPVNLDVTFTTGASYLGQWGGSGGSIAVGTDLRPWTSGISHEIRFNADLMVDTGDNNYLWFDPTPLDGSDLEFRAWDALSVARHEIGHMLGFTDDFYVDDFGTSSESDPWSSLIDAADIFDPGGLNVQMVDGGAGARRRFCPQYADASRHPQFDPAGRRLH